jgi:hypothetical protein
MPYVNTLNANPETFLNIGKMMKTKITLGTLPLLVSFILVLFTASPSFSEEPKKLSGTIAGYQAVDVDNDGLKELVVASVTGESVLTGLPKSWLVVYDLE